MSTKYTAAMQKFWIHQTEFYMLLPKIVWSDHANTGWMEISQHHYSVKEFLAFLNFLKIPFRQGS